jgi:hypothetical protein
MHRCGCGDTNSVELLDRADLNDWPICICVCVFAVNWCWSLTAQSFLVVNPAGLMTSWATNSFCQYNNNYVYVPEITVCRWETTSKCVIKIVIMQV